MGNSSKTVSRFLLGGQFVQMIHLLLLDALNLETSSRQPPDCDAPDSRPLLNLEGSYVSVPPDSFQGMLVKVASIGVEVSDTVRLLYTAEVESPAMAGSRHLNIPNPVHVEVEVIRANTVFQGNNIPVRDQIGSAASLGRGIAKRKGCYQQRRKSFERKHYYSNSDTLYKVLRVS